MKTKTKREMIISKTAWDNGRSPGANFVGCVYDLSGDEQDLIRDMHMVPNGTIVACKAQKLSKGRVKTVWRIVEWHSGPYFYSLLPTAGMAKKLDLLEVQQAMNEGELA